MKRIRKMVSLQEVTERIVRARPRDQLEQSLLQGLPSRLFGEWVSQKIERIRIEEHTLFLYISDPVWRRELENQRLTLLERVKSFRPEIRAIRVVLED